MNPILYRYKDTESVIKVMDGYTPVEGWTPLFDEETIKAATAAALERAAEVCVSLRDETVMSKYASIGNCTAARDSAQRCYEAICALKERP
jgi:hypothetical protein